MSTSRCDQIVKTCKDLGYTYAGLTDIASVSGVVKFIQECQKEDMKPIIGSELILDEGHHLTLICKNTAAWHELIRVVSKANDNKDVSISFDELKEMITANNFVVIDGYVSSVLFYKIFPDLDCIFDNLDGDSLEECLNPEWKAEADNYIASMIDLFGDDYYIEKNDVTSDSFPVYKTLLNKIKEIDKKLLKDRVIPNTSSYYPKEEDKFDHKILLCSKLRTTLKKLEGKIYDSRDINLLSFIRSADHFINAGCVQEGNFGNISRIFSSISEYNILSSPKLPTVELGDTESEIDALRQLCREGWKKLIVPIIRQSKDGDVKQDYAKRVKNELQVIEKANLAGYFLIVQDYVNHFRNQGCLIGPARGSGGGSLVCYLTGITLVDPIKYGLLFDRFYNEGRNTKDHVSLPDIDVDFPPDWRDKVIEYLNEKYGDENVCQMITFGKLAGKSILKEVLRANESCSFDEMNIITSKIPNEASISDLLESMDNPSVIRWALENDKESLIDYCWLGENGELEGDYAREFNQALRMEGIFKTQGKHAAGVVISSDPIESMCPLVRGARGGNKLGGFEMNDLEAAGGVKFDILGVNLLQRVDETSKEI